MASRATPSMRPRRAEEELGTPRRRRRGRPRVYAPRERGLATLVSHAGMEMTAYPVLVEVQSEMSRMKIIYDLYSAFEKFREDMSLTAWGELDVELLKEGVDKAEKEIKKLPKELKELSKYKAYELVVVSFKESLPVIVNLKNDAVKQARARRPVCFGPRRGHRRGVGRTRSRRWRLRET